MAYILDSMTATPVAVYALRKLVNGYSGSAIRVRRSNDNAEADIGFDANGDLDTSALTSHVGSNSGYVVTWYDQTTNGYNATQSTTGKQPRIVDSGTIDVDANGNPWIVASNTNEALVYTGTTWSQPNTYFTVFKYDDVTDLYIFDSTNTSARNALYRKFSNAALFAGTTETGTGDAVTTNQYIRTSIFDTTSSKYFRNGTQYGGTLSPGSNSQNGITLFARFSNDTGGSTAGKFSEFLMFNSALSDTDRRYLETDQADYYSITHADPLYPTGGSVDITHVIGEATADGIAPTIEAKRLVNISHVIGEATAEGLAPTIEVPRTVNIVHVIGEAIASGINPTRIGKPTSSGGARLRLGLGLGL